MMPNSDCCCPLCQSSQTSAFHQDSRTYFRCPECLFVFVCPHQFLSAQDEKAIYDTHENSAEDLGYRHFLNRLFLPLSQRLLPQSCGLDFGSGSGPTLSVMFEEAGHSMELYDLFYAPDTKVFQQQYDFISASEVVEHLHHPRRELERLWSCLKPNGVLGIMTKRVIDQAAFSRWHYKSDLTHVCFFSIETFEWLANHWQAALTISGNDVVLLTKTEDMD